MMKNGLGEKLELVYSACAMFIIMIAGFLQRCRSGPCIQPIKTGGAFWKGGH